MSERFGQLIGRRLEELAWTTTTLAERVGMSRAHIANLISNRSTSKSGSPQRLPASTVDKIASALGLPKAQAREAAGLAPPTPTDPTTMATLNAISLELNTESLRTLLVFARALLNDQKAQEGVLYTPPPADLADSPVTATRTKPINAHPTGRKSPTNPRAAGKK